MAKAKVTREQQKQNVLKAKKRIEFDFKNRGTKKANAKNKL